MRLFIGIGLPGRCREAIAEAVSSVRERGDGISWTRAENLHLTLKFLGEVAEDRVEGLAEGMARAAGDVRPFDLVLEGVGGFPSIDFPRILWVGIREPLDPVRKLHQNMENVLSGAGFPREGRIFHPHVTVARVRKRLPRGRSERIAAALAGRRFGIVHAESYRLYESRLSPAGAVYAVVREIRFGGAPETTKQGGA
ncbi:MAG: RNA 2',3'-cyclic phosphodiesterase [Deltaproteobacteria bacterium]